MSKICPALSGPPHVLAHPGWQTLYGEIMDTAGWLTDNGALFKYIRVSQSGILEADYTCDDPRLEKIVQLLLTDYSHKLLSACKCCGTYMPVYTSKCPQTNRGSV